MTPEEKVFVDRVLAEVETNAEGEAVMGVFVRMGLLSVCATCQAPHREEGHLCQECRVAAIRAEQT